MDDFTALDGALELDDLTDLLPHGPRAPRVSFSPAVPAPKIPAYLKQTYYWAYVNPRNVRWLDRDLVVRTILWQQHNKLRQLAFAEIERGKHVLQTANVYGDFSVRLVEHIGPSGILDVVDVAPVQVKNARRKLKPYPNAEVHRGNVLHLDSGPFDVVLCYFLLHEIPDVHKFEAVKLFLDKVKPGGKVVFVDYHKPRWWHPLKLITSIVFDTLEPFAKTLWRKEIHEFAPGMDGFEWSKQTLFGGLFQKVVATRRN